MKLLVLQKKQILQMLATFIFAFVALYFVATNFVLAQTTPQINYQGKLTDNAGAAVADGTYNMRFWLLQSPSQATTSAAFTEELTGANRVTVSNGLFSVMLGSTTDMSSVDFNQALYLGVEIGGTGGTPAWDGEMSPRKILGSVPAAFEARQLGGVASTSFLRSDQADTASSLLTFTGGLVSNSSSTITDLTTLNATTTNFIINGERFTDLTGVGLINTNGVLSVSSSSLNITEDNALETTITGIADTEIFIGNGADSGTFAVISGDATLANTGALTLASTINSVTTLANLTTTGALNAGSITSGFGNIDIGASNLDADGTITFGGITNGLLFANGSGALSASTSIAASFIDDAFLRNDGDTTTGNLIFTDNTKALFGTGSDASIYYDGTNFVFDSQEVGSGNYFFQNGNVDIASSLAVGNAAGATSTIMVNALGSITSNAQNAIGIQTNPEFTGTVPSGSVTYFGIQAVAEADAVNANGNNAFLTGMKGVAQIDAASDVSQAFGGDYLIDQNSSVTLGVGNVLRSTLDTAVNTTISTGYGLFTNLVNLGTTTNYYGIFINDVIEGTQTNGYAFWTNEGDMILDGDGDGIAGGTNNGSDLFFGEGQDAAIWFDGTDLNIATDGAGASGIRLNSEDDTFEFYYSDVLGADFATDGLNLATGDSYQINNTSVLNATTLGTAVVTSSLTTVGALNSGSITSGFGNIDIGASNLDADGTITFGGITNGLVFANGSGGLSASTSIAASFIDDAYVRNTGDTMTGTLVLGNTGLQIGSSVPFSDSAGTLTLQNVDAIDATTETTIETAIDTLSNLTSASALATVGTITSGVWQGTDIDSQFISTSTLNIAIVDTIGILAATRGGTGFSTYATGDIIFASGVNTLGKLVAGGEGTVLKISGGVPTWGVDISSSGGDGLFATNTASTLVFPTDVSDVVVIGASATTTTGNIFEVVGSSLFDNIVAIGATTTSLFATTLGVGSDYFTDLTGTGLTRVGNSLTATLGVSITASEIADGDHGAFTYTSNVATLDNSSVSSSTLNAPDWSSGRVLQASSTAAGGFAWQATSSLGINFTETNSLETLTTGIADTEIFIGNGADSGTYAVISGDATLANTGALTLASTITSITSLANLVTVGALNAGSITSGFGAIDNGTSNITTGGILKVDVDGTAINAAGSLTLGTGNDAGIWFDGTDLNIATDGAGASGIRLNSEDDTFEFYYSDVLGADFATDGLSLATGDSYQINNTSVLNATTLGTAVVNSSLTSVGTLTALQVDNININLNTISSTAGTDLNITPLAGQQIVLDGTIEVDAGVVTGVTSIDYGATTLLASRSLTVDTGGVFNIALSSAAGDDFTVDTDKLVVEGDTGFVGVGTSSPSHLFSVAGDAIITGALYDGTNSAGTNGMVLKSTATGMRWVATSSLGLAAAHDAVTVTGEDYLSLSGQQITANAIDPDNLSASDFGDFTCNGTTCSLDTDSVDANELAAGIGISNFTNDSGYLADITGQSFLDLADTINSFTTNRVLYTSGSDVVDSANLVFTGTNFGIGSTTPSALLSVEGATSPRAIVRDSTNGQQVQLAADDSRGYLRAGINLDDTAANLRITRTDRTATNIDLFEVYANDSFFTGNVGVGTSTPASLLHVFDAGESVITISGGNGSDRGIDFNLSDNTDAWSLVMDANEDLVLQEHRAGNDDFRIKNTDGTDLFFVDTSAGDIGIGTTTPAARLAVSDDTAILASFYRESANNAAIEFGNLGGSRLYVGLSSGGDFAIDDDSNLGVGPLFSVDGTTGATTIASDLTVSGGDITLGATSIFSGGDTASLNNIDAIDATTETTIETAIDTLANLTSASALITVGALNSGSIATGFGAIDNGTSNITTGGILKVDVDGTAINAAGSLTLGTGNDAGIWFDGTDLNIATDGAGASGIRLNSEDDTFEFYYSDVLGADFATDGLSLATGDSYQINNTSVLNATTLGTAVVNSSLTSVGTLTALQVDNININLNTISSTAGTDLNITPLAGQQIVLDGTIEVDAGVVTGVTSIDYGATTLLASRSLTVDTGGVFNIALSSAAGDDFTVDTDKLVVEGDTGKVGIGVTNPNEFLDVAGNINLVDGNNRLVLYRGGATAATQDFISGDTTNTGDIFLSARQDITVSLDSDNTATGRAFTIVHNDLPGGSPTTLFAVNDSAQLSFDGDTDTFFSRSAVNQLAFTTGGTLALTLDASQNATFAGTVDLTGTLTFGGTGSIAGLDSIDATTETTIETAIDTLSNLTTTGALDSGSITANFGAIDNGTSNITTGGILTIDVDGTAINAAGSLTLGAGNDSAIYWNGTNLEIDTTVGIDFSINGTPEADLAADGLSLATGDSYQINNTSVLNATTLGTAVVNSSLTSVGTLTALQVDNININLNTISSTAGTDLNITPLAGQQIVLDGAIEIDAGVVTGVTSIDYGATTLLASRSLTVDTGGVFNIALSSAAGDDFTVDTDKLVVEGDTGKVGIGTSTPDEKLTIIADATDYALRLDNSSSDGGENPWRISPTGSAWVAGDNKLVFTYDGIDSLNDSLLTIDSAGNVGISITPPVTGLGIARGTADSDPAILRLQSATEATTGLGDVYAGIEFGVVGGENTAGAQEVSAYIKAIDTRTGESTFEDSGLSFGTMGTADAGPQERMVVDHTGNVGIGDTTPAAMLTVGNGDLFQVDSSGQLAAGSIISTFGAIDNGTSNITTGGILKVDVDGTAINAAGSLTLGTGSDAGIWFDGTDLNIATDGAGASGIRLNSEDDTFEFYYSDVLGADFATDGLSLATGDSYQINNTSVLNATTLGTAVVNSSLTSVGTLTALQVDNLNFDGNTISTTAGVDLFITPLAGQDLILDNAIEIDGGVMTGLTDFQVDNININGNVISSTAGTDLSITPLAGQQIMLDGTIEVDAGVVTGVTSIDYGATTLLASRSLTVDTGGVFNIALSSAAGDDFTVDTDKLVVEGDTGFVGIGDTDPNQLLGLLGTNAQISVEESGTEFLRVGVGETAGTSVIGWDDADTLSLGVYSSPTDVTVSSLMTILSSGNVGIGSTTPTALLAIESASNPEFILRDSTVGSQLQLIVNDTTSFIRAGDNLNDTSANLRITRTDRTSTNIDLFEVYADDSSFTGNIGAVDVALSGNLDVASTIAVGSTATAASTKLLNIDGALTSTNANTMAIFANPKFSATLTSSPVNYYGLQFIAEADAVIKNGNIANVIGLFGGAQIDGASDVSVSIGGDLSLTQNSSVTLPTGMAMRSQMIVGSGSTITNAYGLFTNLANSGTVTNYYGIWVDEGDMILDGDGNGVAGGTNDGADLFFGEGQDAAIWYDGTDLNINPRVVGSGLVDIGISADANVLRLSDSDGTCDHNPEAGSETVSCSSDRRLKQNIVDAASLTELFMSMRVREYEAIASPDQKLIGVIAQEMLEVAPEYVTMGDNGLYMVQQPGAWELVKLIQEQHTSLEELLTTGTTNDTLLLQSLEASGSGGVWNKLVSLAKKFKNGVLTLSGLVADKITAQKICLNGDCITDFGQLASTNQTNVTTNNNITINETALAQYGTVKVTRRSTSTVVTFETPFADTPVITLTPANNIFGDWWLGVASSTGFEIWFSATQNEKAYFNWSAQGRVVLDEEEEELAPSESPEEPATQPETPAEVINEEAEVSVGVEATSTAEVTIPTATSSIEVTASSTETVTSDPVEEPPVIEEIVPPEEEEATTPSVDPEPTPTPEPAIPTTPEPVVGAPAATTT